MYKLNRKITGVYSIKPMESESSNDEAERIIYESDLFITLYTSNPSVKFCQLMKLSKQNGRWGLNLTGDVFTHYAETPSRFINSFFIKHPAGDHIIMASSFRLHIVELDLKVSKKIDLMHINIDIESISCFELDYYHQGFIAACEVDKGGIRFKGRSVFEGEKNSPESITWVLRFQQSQEPTSREISYE